MNDIAQTEIEVAHALAGEPAGIADALASRRAADAVEVLDNLDRAVAVQVLEAMPLEAAVLVFDKSHLDQAAELIERMPAERAAAILIGIHPDRRADIFRALPVGLREALKPRLDKPMRETLDQLLAYPPQTAGGLMTTEFVSVPRTGPSSRRWVTSAVSADQGDRVHGLPARSANETLGEGHALGRLVTSDPKANVLSAARPYSRSTVSPLTDREEVARLLSRYDLLAVPVVAEDGHVLGIVTVDDVIDAIISEISESTEDIQKFGGSEALDEPYLRIDFLTMIRKRAGWLCALFLSEMLTASAMQYCQAEIEKAIVLDPVHSPDHELRRQLELASDLASSYARSPCTSRSPGLVAHRRPRAAGRLDARRRPSELDRHRAHRAMAAARPLRLRRLLAPVALTVGLALTAIVTFGSMAGSMLPFVLKRFSFDPATASAPFVATLVDVTGLVIYFTVAFLVLRGTVGAMRADPRAGR